MNLPAGKVDHGDAFLLAVLQYRRARRCAVGRERAVGVRLRPGLAAGRGDHRHFVGAEAGDGGIQGVYAVRIVGLHHLHVADVAALQGGAGVFDGGKEAQPHAFPADDAGRSRRLESRLGLIGGVRERLFAQDVLAGADGRREIAVVVPGLRGDVDDVHVRVFAHGLVGVVGFRDLVGFGKGAGAFEIARADGGDAGARHVLQRLHPVGGDRRGGEDAPAQLVVDAVRRGEAEPNVQRRVHGPALVQVRVVVGVVVAHRSSFGESSPIG